MIRNIHRIIKIQNRIELNQTYAAQDYKIDRGIKNWHKMMFFFFLLVLLCISTVIIKNR